MTTTPTEPFTITIETGPRNARTDPDTGLRFYSYQGRDLPSVTSLRRMAGQPHGLVSWLLTQVIDRAVGEVDTLNAMLTRPKRPRERALETNRVKEARKWLRAASTEERDRSSELGTAVHDAAARGLTPATLPDPFCFRKDGKDVEIAAVEIAPRLSQYLLWLEASGAEIVAAEFQVANLTIGYAGSCDLMIRLRDGSRWIVDIKTGKGTYPEHALQVMAYSRGEIVFADDRVDERLTAELHAATNLAVLHLADDHWAFEAIRVDEPLWRAFLGLHAFAMWAWAHQDMASLIRARRTNQAEAEVEEVAA